MDPAAAAQAGLSFGDLVGNVVSVLGQLFSIVGGLGVFIFGMKVLSDGLQKGAGNRMQGILDNMTGRPFSAILTGLGVTSLLQSSSATTVMVVSVVNAGLLSLSGAVGVIMGANIGTTLTAWIVSALGFKVSVSAFALPVVAVGLPLLLSPRIKNKGGAEALVGFGILFLGLGFLKDYMATEQMRVFIKSVITAIDFDFYLLRFPVFVLLGTLLTFLVQSSSAAMTITLTLVSIGALDFQQGAMIVLGENIGTTITAYLASLGANRNAKKASRVHMLFNLIGVGWMFFLFYPFVWVVTAIIPDGTVLFGNENHILYQLSLFHSLFNVTNTLLLVWFIPQLERMASALVRTSADDEPSLRILHHGYQEITDGLIYEARKYMLHLAETVSQMMGRIFLILEEDKPDIAYFLDAQMEDESRVDRLEEDLSRFLSEVSSKDLSPDHHHEIGIMIRTVAELERLGDEFLDLLRLWKKLDKRKLRLSPDMKKGLESLLIPIQQMFNLTVDMEIRRSGPWVQKDIDDLVASSRSIYKQINKKIRSRLKDGANVRLELLFADMVHSLESVSDQVLEIGNYSRGEELALTSAE